jgi:hypothetical protein
MESSYLEQISDIQITVNKSPTVYVTWIHHTEGLHIINRYQRIEFGSLVFYKKCFKDYNTVDKDNPFYKTLEQIYKEGLASKNIITQDSDISDSERLYEWIMDENREPAKTKFTAGKLRDIAREIEYRINKR